MTIFAEVVAALIFIAIDAHMFLKVTHLTVKLFINKL